MKNKDQIPDGLADDKKPSDFPKEILEEGIKVEMEHTSDKSIATEIAMDHLVEDLQYYKKLKKIEKPKNSIDIFHENKLARGRSRYGS